MSGDPRHFAELLASRIPPDVRKAIDNREFNDRLVEAAKLGAEADDPRLTPAKRQEKRSRAQQVLTAVPRAQTERLVAEKVAKAAQLGNGSAADALRRQAREILERNPPAPRHTSAVRKTKEDPPVPVFDAQGNLVGVVDPDDLMPVSGTGKPKPPPADSTQQPPAATAQQAAPAAPDAQVAKSGTRVFDQAGRAFKVPPLCITPVGAKRVAKAAQVKGMVRVTDDDGRSYWADPADLKGPASPEAQARNTGPLKAGGATGLGQPRKTGPARSLPGDGPQRALPGDVPGRQVVKSSIGLPVRTVGEAARERRLARIAKATGRDFSRPHAYAPNPYCPEKYCVCELPWAHFVHPGTGDARQIAKSAWSPGLTNSATERWLTAQRR